MDFFELGCIAVKDLPDDASFTFRSKAPAALNTIKSTTQWRNHHPAVCLGQNYVVGNMRLANPTVPIKETSVCEKLLGRCY